MGYDSLMTAEKQQIGNASEFLVAYYLAAQGHDVFFPYGNSRADLIYSDTRGLIKVQIKTGTKVKTGPHEYEQVRLLSRGIYNVSGAKYHSAQTYQPGEVDELWVVGTHIWNFPSEVFVGKPSLALGTSRGIRSQKNKTYNPDEYIVVAGSWVQPIRTILCHSA